MNRIDLDLEPSVVPCPINHGALTKTLTFVNNTSLPIYITDPTGAHVLIHPQNDVIAMDSIVVYVTHRVRSGGGNLSGLLDDVPPKMASQMIDDFKRRGECTLMYTIGEVDALLRGELLTVKKLGLAFSINPVGVDKTPVRTSMRNKASLVLGVVVVQRHGDPRVIRYVRYYTTVIEVEPMRSRFFDEGVYLTISGGECVEEGSMLKFGFDELISPFRCFETREEAKAFRWEDTIPDIRDARKQLEVQLVENQGLFEERKQAMELEHKTRMNELAIEKERVQAYYRDREYEIKQLQDERKDHYESKSYVRKDGSETLKMIPAFLAAGLTVVGLLL